LALLGRGGYGEVYLTRKIDTGEILALKRMKKSKFTEKNEVLRVLKEREVMVKSRSPWLARLKYCFQTQTHLYMAMEYIPGGDLKNLLDHFGAVPEDEARFYIAEMILAVDDLHKLGYIHRDLKPDNFMIDKSGHLKLIDFGLSKDGWKQKFSKASIKFLVRHTLTRLPVLF
jgi:serine/threonine protein kinase